VLGISTHVLLWPLKIFARHTVLCLVVAGVLILYLALKKDPHSLDTLKPAPKVEQTVKTPKGVAPIIERVEKEEDGDSAFATDTYAMMSEPERAAYSKNFYAIMSTTPDGQARSWTFYNIQGAIRPLSTFNNNSGRVCRKFTEVLKVHRIQQTINGTACDNGGGTWCKLKVNATPQCGLGHKPGTFDGISNAVKNLF
jgi:surface antigen